MANIDLKPCPFCGGEAEVITHKFFPTMSNGRETESYGVVCKNCNTSGYQFYDCVQYAVIVWAVFFAGSESVFCKQ